MRSLHVSLLVFATCVGGQELASAPTLTIKSKSLLRVDPIESTNNGIQVSGVLQDHFSGEPVNHAKINVRLGQRRKLVYTNENGQFQALFALAPSVYTLSIEYAGDTNHSEATYLRPQVDIGKQELLLRIHSQPSYSPGHPIEILLDAEADAAPVNVDLQGTLQLNGQTVRQTVVTVIDGEGVFSLLPAETKQLGRWSLQLSFTGDDFLNGISKKSSFWIRAKTVVHLLQSNVVLTRSESATLEGTVETENGSPLVNAPVTLFSGDQRISSASTNQQGHFSFIVPGDGLPLGESVVQAAFQSSTPAYESSRSDFTTIETKKGAAVPVRFTILILSLCAIAYVLFRSAMRRSEQSPQDRSRPPPARPGLQKNTATPSRIFGRASHYSFNGTVVDSRKRELLTQASMILAKSPVAVSQGVFAVKLAHGEYDVEVSAPGYLATSFHVTAPHKGELHDVTIFLEEIREHLFERYGEFVKHSLPSPELWGVWTPRQILSAMGEQASNSSLSKLTQFVETVYFADQPADQSTIKRFNELATGLLKSEHTPDE